MHDIENKMQLCPLKFNNKNINADNITDNVEYKCEEENCAWWDTDTEECVVHNLKDSKVNNDVIVLVSKEDYNADNIDKAFGNFEVRYLDYHNRMDGAIRLGIIDITNKLVIAYGDFTHSELIYLVNNKCTVVDCLTIY